jgi:hypothetical protein
VQEQPVPTQQLLAHSTDVSQSYRAFVEEVSADLRSKDSARLLMIGDCWDAFWRTKERGIAERDPLRVDTCVEAGTATATAEGLSRADSDNFDGPTSGRRYN